jgi:hypothetical protein
MIREGQLASCLITKNTVRTTLAYEAETSSFEASDNASYREICHRPFSIKFRFERLARAVLEVWLDPIRANSCR